jgi:octaprenyl-diphosphate synthase
MIEPSLDQVRAKIMEFAPSDYPFVNDLAQYALTGRGQMLRPSLLLATSMLGGGPTPPAKAIQLAAMVECIHVASLLHDDVVDGGRFRRKLQTVNAKWGNKEAVLLGDFILAMAHEALSDYPDTRVLKSAHRITRTLAMGELVELQYATDVHLDEETYCRIISHKTASFFAECCYLGGWAANLDNADLERLATVGHSIGMAYQILDDLLDVTGSLAALGKDITHDILAGNITLPIIHSLSAAGKEEPRARLKKALETGDLEFIRENLSRLVMESGGYDYCIRRAESFTNKAADAIGALPKSCPRPVVSAIGQVTEYMFARLKAGGDGTRVRV